MEKIVFSQINTLSKHIDNHTYTISNKTIWKEGVIYGGSYKKDYDSYIKNPNIYSIDSICSYEPQELWDGYNRKLIILQKIMSL